MLFLALLLELLLDLHLELFLALLLVLAILITTQYYYGIIKDLNVYILTMNMEIIGPLLLSIISGMSTLLGSLIIFFKIKKVGEFITFSLSLSMIIMIMISIVELIPESYAIIINNYGKIYGLLISILVFLLGYQTIHFINKMIHSSNSLYRIGILNMISMMLHNFPEGIAVFMSAYSNIKMGLKLSTAIILHNIPEGMIISIPLYYSGKSRGVVVGYTILASISEPLGALLSYIILKNIINQLILSYVLMFVSGLMISLSINDILKEILSYNKYKYMIIGIITGILLSVIIL